MSRRVKQSVQYMHVTLLCNSPMETMLSTLCWHAMTNVAFSAKTLKGVSTEMWSKISFIWSKPSSNRSIQNCLNVVLVRTGFCTALCYLLNLNKRSFQKAKNTKHNKASLVTTYAALRLRDGFFHPHMEQMKDSYMTLKRKTNSPFLESIPHSRPCVLIIVVSRPFPLSSCT